MKVGLLFASSGLEAEIVDRAAPIELGVVGEVPVARSEELLSMTVLSMSETRLQDRIDAQQLLAHNPGIDLASVRKNLAVIRERGFNRNQDLDAKLASLVPT